MSLSANEDWAAKAVIFRHSQGNTVVTLVGWTQPIVKQFTLWRHHWMELEAVHRALATVACTGTSKAAGVASDELGHGDRLGVYDDEGTAVVALTEFFNRVSEMDDTKVSLGVAGVMGKDEADKGQADSDKFGVGDLLVSPGFTMRKALFQVAGHGEDVSPDIW